MLSLLLISLLRRQSLFADLERIARHLHTLFLTLIVAMVTEHMERLTMQDAVATLDVAK